MSKTIEEIKKEYAKKNGYDSFQDMTSDFADIRNYDVNDIAQGYAQSQTQELQDQNAELVEMLLGVQKILEERYVINYASQIHFEIKELLSKYNHLKSNINETDKI